MKEKRKGRGRKKKNQGQEVINLEEIVNENLLEKSKEKIRIFLTKKENFLFSKSMNKLK